MLASYEPQVSSPQNIVHFVPGSILAHYQEQTYMEVSLLAFIVTPKRKIKNQEFFLFGWDSNSRKKELFQILSLSTLKEMPHNFSQVIKKNSLCQLVLHFLMCISCSTEDMTEFKDQPKHYADAQHPCCKLHSSQTINLYLENMQIQQKCLVGSIRSRLRPSMCYPSEVKY